MTGPRVTSLCRLGAGFGMILLLASSLTHSLIDPDLGWHLVVGRWIIAHHQLPTVDYWNRFSGMKAWVPYSWSTEVLFAFVEENFQSTGLLWLQYVFGILLALSLFLFFRGLSGDAVSGFLLASLSVASCSTAFTLRPQVLTWIILAGIISAAERYRQGETRLPLLSMGLLCCFWANCHLSAILGLLAGVLWSFESGAPKRAVLFALCGFLGTLLTPHFGKEWLVFLSKVDHPLHFSNIAEFQPATLKNISNATLAVVLFFLVWLFAERPSKKVVQFFLLALLFSGLGFRFIKFIPYAGILTAAAIAVCLRERKEETPLSRAWLKLKASLDSLPNGILAFFLLSSLWFSTKRVDAMFEEPWNKKFFPVDAMNYVTDQHLSGPVLHGFNEGGYLLYRFLRADGTVEQQAVIDGRTNVNDPKILEGFNSVSLGALNWRNFFHLVDPQTVVWKNTGPLPSLLLATGEWCLVYTDASHSAPADGWTVFSKRNQTPCPPILLRDDREALAKK